MNEIKEQEIDEALAREKGLALLQTLNGDHQRGAKALDVQAKIRGLLPFVEQLSPQKPLCQELVLLILKGLPQARQYPKDSPGGDPGFEEINQRFKQKFVDPFLPKDEREKPLIPELSDPFSADTIGSYLAELIKTPPPQTIKDDIVYLSHDSQTVAAMGRQIGSSIVHRPQK